MILQLSLFLGPFFIFCVPVLWESLSVSSGRLCLCQTGAPPFLTYSVLTFSVSSDSWWSCWFFSCCAFSSPEPSSSSWIPPELSETHPTSSACRWGCKSIYWCSGRPFWTTRSFGGGGCWIGWPCFHSSPVLFQGRVFLHRYLFSFIWLSICFAPPLALKKWTEEMA